MDGVTEATGSSVHVGAVKATEEPATMVLASAATALMGPVDEKARYLGVRNTGCGPA